MWRTCKAVSIAAVAFIAIQTALTAQTSSNTVETEEVTVTGEATDSLTSGSPEESAKQKMQVPGPFTVKTNDDMELGRASNFEDLLQRTPGVFLQSENGSEVSKISIRGSGITSEDEPLGVMFLMDGLNFNQGDGETTLEDLDVATISHAEIFRGANAFKYGALTLGGAINLVPFTGYDAAPFQVRLEGGSYGFFRGDMNGGAVQGKFDDFGAISFRARDGFREHSREDTEILFADFGYKFSDQVENRFYLTLDHTNRNLPGGLTKSQMEDDPSQANPLAIAQDWNKELSNVRLADKLSIRTEEIQLDVGAFWFHHDLENRGFFSPDFREGIEEFYSDNFGGNLNFVSRHELFGQRSIFTIGLSPQVRRRAHPKLRKYFRTHRSNDCARHRQLDKCSSLSRGPAVSHTAVIDYRRSTGDFRGASFPGRVLHRQDRKSIKPTKFLGIQSEAGRDLRNQSPDTGIHKFQSQLATAFDR